MAFTKIIHEGGLTARSAPESREILERYGVQPVLAIEARATGDMALLLSRSGAALGVQASSLYSARTNDIALLFKAFALAYDVGAALHHCESLAKAYEFIVVNFQRISSIPGFETSESEFASFGYQAEPYYELDALLSAARRAYDKIGHCVWHAFEGRGGGMPDNMRQLLDRITACPRTLAERLNHSWLTVGEKLKDYRDCTQHFASADMGLGTVMMRRVGDGVWKAWARIPDNPETKSKKKFTYVAGIDALTYGWEVVNEVVSLATEVVTAASAVAQPPKSGDTTVETDV
jgi:hypothetical protein